MIETICRQCRTPFAARRRTAAFCDDACRKQHQRRTHSEMQRHEWYTASAVVEAARNTMGAIDLDPASSPVANEIVCANRYFTVRDDGLAQPWSGRIWLNPPYGKLAPKFVAKFYAEYQAGRIDAACLLLAVHHVTTVWFEALRAVTPIYCFPAQRLKFSGVAGRPMHGSVILGIGVDPQAFTGQFGRFGLILHSATAPQ
jgi:hypothetical protein